MPIQLDWVVVLFKIIKLSVLAPVSLTLDQVNKIEKKRQIYFVNHNNLIEKQGGFGIGLGVGAAVATPLGNFALGEGQSE